MAITETDSAGEEMPRKSASGGLQCGAHTVGVSRPDPETMLITVMGELDLAVADRLREVLQQRIKSCLRRVVLDLSAVSFCDSAGMDLVRECRVNADAYGTTFRVVAHTPGPVTRLFWLVDPSLLDTVSAPENP